MELFNKNAFVLLAASGSSFLAFSIPPEQRCHPVSELVRGSGKRRSGATSIAKWTSASAASDGEDRRDRPARYDREGESDGLAFNVIRVGRSTMHCLQSCDQPPSTGSSAPVVKVASNARKRTALAISSDVPKRFIGTIPVIFSLIWAASSLPVNTLSMIGVLIGPGVTALTRISRGSNSAASVRANERIAALAAPYAALPGIPLTFAIEVVKTTEPPRFISGASFKGMPGN